MEPGRERACHVEALRMGYLDVKIVSADFARDATLIRCSVTLTLAVVDASGEWCGPESLNYGFAN